MQYIPTHCDKYEYTCPFGALKKIWTQNVKVHNTAGDQSVQVYIKDVSAPLFSSEVSIK